ncbi:hypothetical protein O7599_31080 [Streptomyces sp. WMMC500]|uniref:hypothetical protein n=1 Tax=Streptomyces sp. WMMC500 TaxID=3015154 RepID=UPI00248C109F|nr:hypothetical protein [Streptomyces sp. WMMC500]WBB59944.1 hypothetical protein O7599_31080 [Streptomyces sp. WMMC500]
MTYVTRRRPATYAAITALLVVLLASCGSSEPETSPGKLFQEYTKSVDVKNDRFPSDGASSEDRLANFAAYYTPEQLQGALLSATPCDATADVETDTDYEANTGCPPGASVSEAARDFAGSEGELFRRSVLVKREDGSLELITLYVARAPDKTAALIDSHGKTYTGGLDDFRENNELLGSDDVILTLRNITSVPGEGRIVTVFGHTPSKARFWLIGGVVTVVVIGLGLTLAGHRRTRTATDAQTE